MHTTRARDLGIPFAGTPGRHNAITDVPGIEVGYTTLIHGEPGADSVARTGVTAILPRGRAGVGIPCAAGTYSLNGNGELTGRAWIDESGSFSTPIAITSSHAVGAVHRGVDEWVHAVNPAVSAQWMLPVVGETWDGYLNQINAGHVEPAHARTALDAASPGPIAEGSVGGGTGMNCYGFKGGTGTASRVIDHDGTAYTVGVLMQANFGSREEFTVAGRPLGPDSAAPAPIEDDGWFLRDGERARSVPGAGSVIVVVATDAPLLPGQCAALARRVPLGLARTGTTGSHFSGDIFLAFSTANSGSLTSRMADRTSYESLRFIPWGRVDALYTATVQAVEEAVVNALVAAEDMAGREDHVSYALPHDEVRAAFS
ncbi:P1 family peptidase [Microbacterium thalassium]|uniref:L-aminopeptidase/D-esterase-like protein n=1 Tax=Microbacterium thalassium TaxID=362649 RepID=A0A7X0FNT0_9MICO|nr:P1 family peptidase [Microbacterium thalassium]MBB6390942.1 L-aminopeptidase/D-esterase-like protein [Microbacterium thalassium]GLK26051.1 aminopeptidase [Microbacterium thalassium]